MNVTLTTTGRRTGKRRAVRLYGYEDGDRLVIVGSRGGAGKDPAWAGNLRAEPRATMQRGKQVQKIRAYEAKGSERDRLWKLVMAAFPLYEKYQRRTDRMIPLFVLEPAADG